MLTFTAPTFAQAQGNTQTPEQKLEADAKTASKDICGCLNKFFDELHPKLVLYMNDMSDLGKEEADKKFFSYIGSASSEEQAIITADAQRLSNFDAELKNYCPGIEERYAAYDDNDEFEAKTLSNLSQLPECKTVYSMYKLGQQEDGGDQ
jgi:hypothetical protein